jgi:hypothetical protein
MCLIQCTLPYTLGAGEVATGRKQHDFIKVTFTLDGI